MVLVFTVQVLILFWKTALSVNGNAFGAALQVLGTVSNCTFEYNQANSDVNNSHAGALCFRPESTVYNCTL